MPKLKHSALLFGGNAIALALQFASIPIYLHLLGKPTYSYCMFLLITSYYVVVAVPDTLQAAIKLHVEARIGNDKEKSALLLSTHRFLNLVSTVLIMVSLFVVSLFIFMPNGKLARVEIIGAFLIVGLSHTIRLAVNPLAAVVQANERFDIHAKSQLGAYICGIMSSIFLIWLTKEPLAFYVNLPVNEFMYFVFNRIQYGKIETLDVKPEKEHAKKTRLEMMLIGIRAWPNTAISIVSNSADKVLLNWAVKDPSALANYSISARIPDALNGLVGPLLDNVTPSLTATAATSDKDFSDQVSRYATIAAVLAGIFVILPSAYAGPFMLLWLHGNCPKEGYIIAWGMSIYIFLNFYMQTLSRAYNAKGIMHHAIPFSSFNAICTACLTLPITFHFGIVGLAFMNAFINLLLFVPYLMWLKKKAANHLNVQAQALVVLGLLVFFLAMSGALTFVFHETVLFNYPLACLATAPILTGFCLIGALRFGGRAIPQQLRSKLKRTRFARITRSV